MVDEPVHLCRRVAARDRQPRRNGHLAHVGDHGVGDQPASCHVQRGTVTPLRDQPTWFRWLGPFLLVDQLFALSMARDELSSDDWRRFYLSAGIFNFIAWVTAVTVGLFVGSAIPPEWRLNAAPAIMFAGLIALGLTNRPGIVAAVTGAGVCYLALGVPNNGGILIGALSGVIAGYLADVAQDRRAAASTRRRSHPATRHQGPHDGRRICRSGAVRRTRHLRIASRAHRVPRGSSTPRERQPAHCATSGRPCCRHSPSTFSPVVRVRAVSRLRNSELSQRASWSCCSRATSLHRSPPGWSRCGSWSGCSDLRRSVRERAAQDQGSLPTWARASRISRSWPLVICDTTSLLTASSGVNHVRSSASCVGSQSPSTGTT